MTKQKEIREERWWDRHLKKWRLYPHLICDNLWDGRYKCLYCGLEGDYNRELTKVSCTERKSPCPWCGGTPLCKPDCVGIRMLLSDPKVYVIGDNPFEPLIKEK